LIQKVDHVGIAVTSMAEAATLFGDVLGGVFLSGGDNRQTGLRLVQFMLPGFKVELLAPLQQDCVLAAYLDKHGPGFHHLTLLVDDVPLTVRGLAEHGLTATGTSEVHPRWSETYLPPAEAFGTLLQFVSTTLRWNVPAADHTVADVLAGRVEWRDWIACPGLPPCGAGDSGSEA
jgi:methylmalonyl-CoA/ethylmalonyl-CoA epimerase